MFAIIPRVRTGSVASPKSRLRGVGRSKKTTSTSRKASANSIESACTVAWGMSSSLGNRCLRYVASRARIRAATTSATPNARLSDGPRIPAQYKRRTQGR